MEAIRQLLLIFAGIVLINLALSAAFWIRYRTKLHRGLFLVWATTVLSAVIGGVPVKTSIGIALSSVPGFLVSLSLADLLGRVASFQIRRRFYWLTLAGGVAVAFVAHLADAPFWAVALPISAAIAVPLIDTPMRGFLSRDFRFSMPGKAAAVSCVIYGPHLLDYPFLRDGRPSPCWDSL